MRIKYIILFFYTIYICNSFSQDVQFTQFYASPLYLNPAFAGATSCWRVGGNYRNQWFLGDRPYQTGIVYGDKNLRHIGAGVGAYIMYDTPGAGGYQTFEFAAAFAKQIKLGNNLQLRIGLQPSYHIKYLTSAASQNIFGDQITNLQGPVGGTSDNPTILGSYNFFDLSSGVLLYSKSLWLGIAAHHLLRNPFIRAYSIQPVPMKLSLHGGYKFQLNDANESTLTPAFQLKQQGYALQFDVGLYYERSRLVLGTWYRGIPIITGKGINSDALAFLVGYRKYDFRICYSYDLPLSRMISTFGSHEISIIFEFCSNKKQKPPKYIQQLPCPSF
ncbi:MAG: type IX secretion system membrane protein PorP/SprF [Cytophagales bacterium]|nr:MAG: type IX secretion system membrane protein PorP/SprF [Cytophagales bacterium]